MTPAIGSGLIAAGTLLALATVLAPPSDDDKFEPEGDRQERNTTVATLCAAIFGFAGAVLVLVGSEWIYAFVAAAGATLIYYGLFVATTHRVQRHILTRLLKGRAFDRADDGSPGRITLDSAAEVGLIESGFGGQPLLLGAAGDPQAIAQADEAEARARRRARLWWALHYPYGIERPAPLLRAAVWARRLVSSW